MAAYVCTNCGNDTTKWAGQCPSCKEWGTLKEFRESSSVQVQLAGGKKAAKGMVKDTQTLQHIQKTRKGAKQETMETAISELDRVFGGGITEHSVTLLAGEPGIGKSTLTLMLCKALTAQNKSVLYVTGEESLQQVGGRAERLKIEGAISLMHETAVEDILATVREEKPDVLFVDSIQVMYSSALGNTPGSIQQIRVVTELLVDMAKNTGVTVFIIGHVTKEGGIAGPKALEHLVDTVAMLEGDRGGELRLLRTTKNRFGPTDEVGVFQMSGEGLEPVENPSAVFLSGRRAEAPGSVLTATMEGTRSFLLEVQSLAASTKFGYPKRTAVGCDARRLEMLLAVAGKFMRTTLDSYDVYVNIVGGLRIKETSLDLALLASILSSRLGKPLPEGTVVFGEVGLTGEVRSVVHMDKRIREAERMGMQCVVVPASAVPKGIKNMRVIPVDFVGNLPKVLFDA